MYILLNSKYKTILLPMDCIAIIEKMIDVEEKDYGKDKKVYPTGEIIGFEILRDDQFKKTEEDSKELLIEKLKSSEKLSSDRNLEAYNLKKEMETLKKELEVYKQTCPHKKEE